MDCSPPGPSLHGIPRQEYWSGLPFPSAGELPHSGIRPTFPALAGRFFITELSGKPKHWGHGSEETNNGISFCRQTVHVIIRKLSCQCDFPGSASAKESACQTEDMRHGFHPWVGKNPWRRKWQPTPIFLPGNFHGQRSLAGYSPCGRKESDMTEHPYRCDRI